MSEKMLRAKEVMERTGYSLSKSYNIINKLKKKNKCTYSEACISEKIFKENYS